jgi:serine/threonine protein kinase
MTGDPAPQLQRSALEPLRPVGEGGQGYVYLTDAVKINSQWPVAYKEYKPGTRFDAAMLSRMVAFVPEQDEGTGRWLCEATAWPAALIGVGGTVRGFLMRRIPDEFQQPWGDGGAVVPAAMQFLLNPQSYLTRKGITVTNKQRLQILESVADTLSRLHSLNVVVGDLSPNNLLVRLDGNPGCFFIDCDAMRLHGDDVLEQVETPEWNVPRAAEPIATTASDAYKFGLLAVRLFAQDQMGADVSALAGVSAELGVLARRSLDDNSAARPSPGQWLATLRAARQPPAFRLTTTPGTGPVPPQPVVRTAAVPWPAATVPSRAVPGATGPGPAVPGSAASGRARASQPTSYQHAPARPSPVPYRKSGSGTFAKVIGTVILIVLAVLAIMGVDKLANADDNGSAPTGTEAVPESAVTTTGNSNTGNSTAGDSTTAAPAAGIVAYDPVAERSDAASVAGMLAAYFDAVNDHDWPALLALYDPGGVVDPTDPDEAARFTYDMSTTRDTDVRLRAIRTSGNRTYARVTFTSHQEPSFGPKRNRNETCTRWDITFRLAAWNATGYRILGSQDSSNKPC